jgi:uncharacterized protein YjiS (DUF1127 family)
MMGKTPRCGYRLSSLDYRQGERHRAIRWSGTTSACRRAAARLLGAVWASSVGMFDRPARQGSLLWVSPDVPLTGSELRRAERRQIAPPTKIRRIIAAIRLWRRRVRSRQELRELDDHLLKDIGLSRADVFYEVAKPFWR